MRIKIETTYTIIDKDDTESIRIATTDERKIKNEYDFETMINDHAGEELKIERVIKKKVIIKNNDNQK